MFLEETSNNLENLQHEYRAIQGSSLDFQAKEIEKYTIELFGFKKVKRIVNYEIAVYQLEEQKSLKKDLKLVMNNQRVKDVLDLDDDTAMKIAEHLFNKFSPYNIKYKKNRQSKKEISARVRELSDDASGLESLQSVLVNLGSMLHILNHPKEYLEARVEVKEPKAEGGLMTT